MNFIIPIVLLIILIVPCAIIIRLYVKAIKRKKQDYYLKRELMEKQIQYIDNQKGKD